MTTVSPPKPWERAATLATSAQPIASSTAMTTSSPNPISNPSSTTDNNTPTLPERPNTLNNVVNQTASNYSGYGQNRLANPYSSYSSPYGGMGGAMGGGMYGGYGSMGGYGGYGSMGGMNGMYGRPPYGGFGGMPGQDPNNPNNSLTASWNQSTAATFQIMESIVGAFGGFAQMLESAYMTTHSSFFAMVSMAEQLGNLRQTLGQVLGIYALLRWMRTLLAKVTGRPPPADATALTPMNFSSFLNGGNPTTLPDGSPTPPKASKKPLIMFAIAVFGLPYLMSKLIRSMARAQEAEEQRRQQGLGAPTVNAAGQVLDPSKLEFCRVMYDYKPAQHSVGMDLEVKKGDLVAVLSKSDPMGNSSEWWKCRARDGTMGYLPSPYLQAVQRKPQQQAITQGQESSVSLPGSRTSTLKASDGDGMRTKSLSSVIAVPEVRGRPGDITAESFQKSAFYS